MRERKRPVIPPFQTASYSDGGFTLLGLVLQRITGLSYNDALKTLLAEPLGLTGTAAVEPKGDDLNALVMPGMSSWGSDNHIIAGYVSFFAPI